MNNQRDCSYYEAHAADVCLDEITSSDYNKRALQRLRDGDISNISVGAIWRNFVITEGDDLGWLEYFISRSESLQELEVVGFPKVEEEKEQQIIHALSDGITRNRSIQNVCVNNLSRDGFAAVARILSNLTQLESLTVIRRVYGGSDQLYYVALGNLLEAGVWKLKELSMYDSLIGDAGLAALTGGLRCIGSSLKGLYLPNCSIGDEGLSTLAEVLANCTCLESLDLSENDFSMTAAGLRFMRSIGSSLKRLYLSNSAIDSEGLSTLVAALVDCTCLKVLDLSQNDFSTAAGLRSLSHWVQTAALTLDELSLKWCEINDNGVQALAEGAANNCKEMNLHCNGITALGWRNLSILLPSESCCLESLILT